MKPSPKKMDSDKMQTVPFQDLYPGNRLVEKVYLKEVSKLYRESAFSGGPYVESFEKAFAKYLHIPHCLGLNSGTSAIHVALAALGIGPGDEVIVPAFTFVGSAWGILYCGAKPVCVDVDPLTACLDPASLSAAITSRTKAVIVVHLFGRAAAMDEIKNVLKGHKTKGIALIEDTAQAHGATWKGKALGTLGDVGCFSFYPSKNLGAVGEAGAIVTKNKALKEKIACLRNHGQKTRYQHDVVGFNYRMDGLQGMFLEMKLAYLDRMNADRKGIALAYLSAMDNPEVMPLDGGAESAWHLFVCRVPRRKAFLNHLDKKGIGYGIHYPNVLPELPPFQTMQKKPAKQTKLGNGNLYPHARALSQTVVSLPLYYGMPSGHVERVIDAVESFK
jgi:dTDP-4-amino-4,6-dideoxygalactose transaminase